MPPARLRDRLTADSAGGAVARAKVAQVRKFLETSYVLADKY
ncbi:MAG: hypothetical protein AVDCRST_MAG93-1914 [uncultured Chloroflexia bacterium]|uniref:Uncharacterized protein n=1 Tax=uncultured Chloroflexia bacterium TaxID=1672391 RepID=A0A6J4IN64_9CHLR|nr:MAG: hypothetical protein AVDCRST_MAG93-1914 [uncultured Chloroflexia bacterium]